MFPSQKAIKGIKIPKIKRMETAPKTDDEGCTIQNSTHHFGDHHDQNKTEENQKSIPLKAAFERKHGGMEVKPFDSLGVYKGQYGENLSWNNPYNKTRNRFYKPRPMNADISTPPNESSYQAFDHIPEQQLNQTTINTIVKIGEKTMCVENEEGQRKMISEKVRQVTNIEISIRDLPDKNPKEIEEYLQNMRSVV